tara:strand:- start:127 stop:684 length:558 start_codon:yes stop_codon:yes gene_type:complete
MFWMINPSGESQTSLRLKAHEALRYCEQNDMNTEFCLLVDMSRHSGKNRLFVYQFANDSILSAGLCSHGCCDGAWGSDQSKEEPKFNNIPESHCSSLGKYKIGSRGYSNWGININYKLHGLEASNSKAFSRAIVLHSWDMVGDNETYPSGTPEGWGCPAVSNNQMKFLDGLLKNVEKPVLLWVYQ